MDENLQQALTVALAALEAETTGPDDVAARLIEGGFRGPPLCDKTCPVWQFLKAALDSVGGLPSDAQLLVGRHSASIYGPYIYLARVMHPENVRRFIHSYDSFPHCYPGLLPLS